MDNGEPSEGQPFEPALAPVLCRCGGHYQPGYTTHEGVRVGAVLHTLPICGEFKRLDPIDFMRWARRATEN